MRNDLSIIFILSISSRTIQNILFEILQPNSIPIRVETIYRISQKSTSLEVLNSKMNKINLVNEEDYILAGFNTHLHLNNSRFWSKEIC